MNLQCWSIFIICLVHTQAEGHLYRFSLSLEGQYLTPTLLFEVWPGLSHDALWCPSKPEQLFGDLVLDSPQVEHSSVAYSTLIPSWFRLRLFAFPECTTNMADYAQVHGLASVVLVDYSTFRGSVVLLPIMNLYMWLQWAVQVTQVVMPVLSWRTPGPVLPELLSLLQI